MKGLTKQEYELLRDSAAHDTDGINTSDTEDDVFQDLINQGRVYLQQITPHFDMYWTTPQGDLALRLWPTVKEYFIWQEI